MTSCLDKLVSYNVMLTFKRLQNIPKTNLGHICMQYIMLAVQSVIPYYLILESTRHAGNYLLFLAIKYVEIFSLLNPVYFSIDIYALM